MIPEGTSFGQYGLLRRLGGGGAGEVFLAEQPADGAPSRVVLKVLDGRADDPAVQRLTHEAEVAAGLRNVHIIPYYGLASERSAIAVVMAYAPGGSLGDNLRAGDRIPLPLPPGVVARIVLQLGEALAAAHAAGIIHGDLKPNNVFVRTSPSGAPLAVVSDFGQAILTQAAATLATSGASTSEQASWIAEQLRYAAPEQINGPASPASDQYGLAAVAYYLLTGRPPFTGSAQAVLASVLQTPITPPSRYNPTIPMEAERALLRALAKQPEARFSSIATFAELLTDTLAVPVGQATGAAGVTEQMSVLAASRSGDSGPGSSSGARSTGAALAPAPDLSLLDDLDSESGELPDDTSPNLRRLLAVAIGGAVIALVITCILTASALWSGGNPLQLRSTLGQALGPTPTPTALDQGTVSANAQAAEQQLAGITSQRTPVFSDAFGSNNTRWATGSSVSIHDGHLYLTNSAGQTPALATTPTALQLSAATARVDVALTDGSPSDQAGLCFWVTTDSKGNPSYFCYLASADGRYGLWQYHGDWLYISGGYSSALKLGMGQANTLALIASARQGYASLFANGHFVSRIHLSISPTLSGNVGLLVLNIGQASFTNYAVYDASV
jgi:serine/threonine protein kinase